MLRNRTFRHLVAREQTRLSLGIHDEGTDRIGGLGCRRVVGYVNPDAATAVPLDDWVARIPGVALGIGAGTVVHDPPVSRPSPRPIGRDALVAHVRCIAPRHLVALFG